MATITNYPSVMPGAPAGNQFISANDPNGFIQAPYQSNLDTTGTDLLRGQALSNNYSPWTALAMQNRQNQNMQDLGSIQQQNAVQQANLMKQGPISQAAMNSIKGSMANYAGNQQGYQNDLQKLRLQGQSDQPNLLASQVKNDMSALQPQEFNIQNTMDQKHQQDTANFTNWQQQMQAWGAAQQAKAQINAGKK